MFIITTATKKLIKLKKRIKAIQGGTSAGKTISILQILIDKAQRDKVPTLTSVVSESFPHLKRGAMRDFIMIMEEHEYFDERRWNRSDFTYTFETGSKLEFFSADQPGKVRGPRRDRLFINEANNVPYETFDQLEVRTKGEIWLDWNPTNEFWYYDEVANRTDVDHLILTYLDNEGLSQEIIDSIEQRRDRVGWWKVYGLGELGEVEGKIYRNWDIIDEIPRFARLERFGLDFGYSNDPTSIVAIYSYDGGYIFDEILHKKGMLNKQIADVILNQEEEGVLVVADSAEPKSIAEIKSYGVNIVGAQKKKKGEGTGTKETYVKWSIGQVQEQQCAITKGSLNVIKAYRNYLWQTDKDGKILNVPEHDYSDAMDAIRYGIVSMVSAPVINLVASEPLPDYYESWN